MSSVFDIAADNFRSIALAFGVAVVVWKFFGPGSRRPQRAAREEKKKKYVVGKIDSLEDGEMTEVALSDDMGSVLLVRENGVYRCTSAKCTHLGAPLKKGVLHNGRVRCPWHGACFSTDSGDIEEMPGIDNLQTYSVMTEGSDLVIFASDSELKEWKRPSTLCSRNARDGRTFAVVGAGAAGYECVETLRKEGFEGRIVLIGQEKYVPYDRTKLSKNMSAEPEKILLRPESWYSENNIELKLGVDAVDLNVDHQTIKLSDGSAVSYDKCFVATGGQARTLPIDGKELPGIHTLRVPEEAAAILGACTKNTKLVIVGSSFIGMEAACTLASKVASVDIIGMEKVPFERVLGSDIGAALMKLHLDKAANITFHMERTVKQFRGDKRLEGVVLDNGVALDADLVVMGAGVVPATQFINGVNKERDQSVVTDAHLCAAKNLYLGGDICRFPLPFLDNHLVRIEHFGVAMYQGRVAAQNMVHPDRPVVCSAIPYFWTVQFGKSVRYCGHALKYDQIIVDGSLDTLEFAAFYCSEGKVLAVASVSRDPIVSMAAELMGTNEMLNEKQLRSELQKDGRITLGGRCDVKKVE